MLPPRLAVSDRYKGSFLWKQTFKRKKEKLKHVDKEALWKPGAVPDGRLLVGLRCVMAGKLKGPATPEPMASQFPMKGYKVLTC